MMLRDLPARTLDGSLAHASDFRGRRNIVLIFPAAREPALVQELRHHCEELREEEAVVLLANPPDEMAAFYGVDGGNPALYIADRYGEIYFAAHPRAAEPWPSTAEILDWLRFINAQCPE